MASKWLGRLEGQNVCWSRERISGGGSNATTMTRRCSASLDWFKRLDPATHPDANAAQIANSQRTRGRGFITHCTDTVDPKPQVPGMFIDVYAHLLVMTWHAIRAFRVSPEGKESCMYEPVFIDKAKRPTDEDLAEAMGKAKARWDEVVEALRHAFPKAKADWKHYAGASGWQFIFKGSGRNLAYLKPLRGRMLVATALSEDAVAAAEEADVPEDLLKAIREGPRSVEGRGVRLMVASAKDVGGVQALIRLKAGG